MFVLAHFLQALATVLNIALNIYMWIIIIRALLSWVNPDPYNPIVRFLYGITEPVLSRIRRVVPPMGGIDLSPLVAILIIIFLQQFLVPVLYDLSYSLR
ncbi:protein of unknown function YGGT [Thermodesulfatator indicus DSM 15286]|uniref:YggT family protein n=1 Tax=Thermodesulfatator indicus (strain DSM 15286 / JCM 11887 / CIR29812) TaxID=667014 RepID=F8ABM7_THEID|nr:YggT family protein [Thermodesulfatator indicus]AEH45628.1 protein of unknown function YGGT [Thermodesulfatator indicus DSM 15286]